MNCYSHPGTVGDFYKVLFDEGEATCFAADPKGTTIFTVYPDYSFNFFSINPIGLIDNAPSESWHSTHVPRRADANVLVYRNILIELDKGSPSEQMATLDAVNTPYSTLVYSGGKSYHAIISLKEPCRTRAEYNALVERVYAKMGGKAVVDTSCGNPSRLSRCPGVWRGETLQTLHYAGVRVSRETLEAWLGPAPVQKGSRSSASNRLSDHTHYFLRWGAQPGDWNRQLFLSACDMARNGFSIEDIVFKCESVTGVLDSADRRTINSAYQTVKRTNAT